MHDIRNRAQFIGTLEADPEIVPEKDGGSVAKLVVACEDDFLKNDGTRSVQHIGMEVPVDAGNEDLLTQIQGLAKGAFVGVEAKLVNGRWTDSAGREHLELKIAATSVSEMDDLGPKA